MRWPLLLALPWAVQISAPRYSATYNGDQVFSCETGGKQDCLWVQEFVDMMNERRRQRDRARIEEDPIHVVDAPCKTYAAEGCSER